MPRHWLLLLGSLPLAGCLNGLDQTDTGPPVILITSPEGPTVSGTVSFSANVVDDFGVDTVEFWAGETMLLQDRLPPYQTTWGTVPYPDGPILLKVVARDVNGKVSQASKTVTVANAPN